MSYQILHDLFIETSAERLFQCFSMPEHLENWWPLKCSGSPIMDAEYNFYFSEEFNWYGRVIRLIENRSFHIKMTKSDPDWDQTSFGFDIQETPKGCLLKFSHSNWKECNSHFRTTSFCWAMLLQGLKNYAEKGIIIPFEQRS